MQSSEEWTQAFTKQIGRGIDKARGKRSDQWIADRCDQVGHPLSRTAISEYRRGIRKTMPITDLIVIAAALQVPPVTLLFPDLPNGRVELLPGSWDVTAFDSLRWFTGEADHLPTGRDALFDMATGELTGTVTKLDYQALASDIAVEHYDSKEQRVLNLCRQMVASYRTAGRISSDLWSALREQDEGRAEMMREWIDRESAKLTDIKEQIESLDGDLTEYTPDVESDPE